MAEYETRDQIDLPNRVALGIVAQGFRIRMGRSMITLLGIVFGIAFLMANFTNQIVRDAVHDEEELRSTVKRMMSFLMSETGLLSGKTIAVLDRGRRTMADDRFEAALRDEGVSIVSTGALASIDAVVALGSGPMEWKTIPDDVPIAVTAPVHRDRAVVELLAPPSAEELAATAAARRAERSRYWWILAISVIVTFMGITNAMLMSVTERFKEIGTMKCLGARSNFIRRLFLFESLFLGCVGGLIGAIVGATFAVVINAIVYGQLVVSLDVVRLAAAGVGCVVAGAVLAVASALSPAHIAASMTPAHALRSNV